uniref:Eukaryotic translation initiation factor 2A n=1 Tax=Plectus sambesii TaxID=2011161 RepID=A0A914XLD1_9BILA
MSENLLYAVRGSTGFSLKRGIKESTTVFANQETGKEGACRVFVFSNSGDYFCYCDTRKTTVLAAVTGKVLFSLDLPRTTQIYFSPKDKVLCTFEPYAVYGAKKEGENQQPSPNVRLWSLPDGQLLTTLTMQKQQAWQPQWTDDESICGRLVGSELLFHKGSVYDKYEWKLVIQKMTDYAVSKGPAPHHVACYIPPLKGQPAVVQLRQINANFTQVSNKTFFKCDNASFLWNCKGTALIVIAMTDVDTTNQSYYGEQNIYLVLPNGESCPVPLAKNGPVYSVKWNPNGREFAAVYGFMPAKVTLYNLRGDATFDMGVGPRNDIHYNRFGTVLLVCGFGNLAAGNMEFWSVEHHKEIVKIEVPNTTLFEWAPDGQHFLTATTTPRLRIDNSYRLWHFTGRLLTEVLCPQNEELWQVLWRPLPDGVYNPFPVVPLTAEQKAMAGLLFKTKNPSHPANNLPAGAITKAGAYVPPHLRNKTGAPGSKAAPSAGGQQKISILSESEKKLRTLQKKISDINALKKRIESGETLEANQLQKIEKEAELLAEIEKLRPERCATVLDDWLQLSATEKVRPVVLAPLSLRYLTPCARNETTNWRSLWKLNNICMVRYSQKAFFDLIKNAIKDGCEFSPDEALMSQGFDSVGLVELRKAIQAKFHVVIPATLFFKYPSPLAISKYLEKLTEEQSANKSDSSSDSDNDDVDDGIQVVFSSEVEATEKERTPNSISSISTESLSSASGEVFAIVSSFVPIFHRDTSLAALGLTESSWHALRRTVSDRWRVDLAVDLFSAELTAERVVQAIEQVVVARPNRQSSSSFDDWKSVSSGLGHTIESDGRNEPIAIIGASCRFAGQNGSNILAFNELLSTGKCGISEVPWSDRPDLIKLKNEHPDARGAFLSDTDKFDAGFFQIMPREAKYIDPQQRLLLETTWCAVEQSGMTLSDFSQAKTGIFVGLWNVDYASLQTDSYGTQTDKFYASGTSSSIASGRLSYFFDAQGPSLTVATACSASLVALHLAKESLLNNECEAAVVCGSNLIITPHMFASVIRAQMLSPDGVCRAFDSDANGYVRGEGIVAVVLKRMSAAVQAGDRILGTVLGTAINNDGKSNGLTAPNMLAQENVYRDALTDAKVDPISVGYLEAHGTGTPLGDPIELQSVDTIYGHSRSADNPLCIGSVKTNIGHSESCSGLAGLLKALFVLNRNSLPAHLHFATFNQRGAIDCGKYLIPVVACPLPNATVAAVSSFGFSGTNAHAIVGKASMPSIGDNFHAAIRLKILALSAKSNVALENKRQRYVKLLEESADELTNIVDTANARRNHFAIRLAVIGSSAAELSANLRSCRFASSADCYKIDSSQIAFLFSGQGTERANMGRELYEGHPLFRSLLDECVAIGELGIDGGSNLFDLLYPKAEPALDTFASVCRKADISLHQTQYSQPAMFCFGYALAKFWIALGVQPTFLVGHSVGEYAAAAVAGMMSLKDAMKLISARGALMQRLAAGGQMLALASDAIRVGRLVDIVKTARSESTVLCVAARNSPAQTVVSGDSDAISELRLLAEELGFATKLVNELYAFHSDRMKPIQDEFIEVAKSLTYRKSGTPIVSNVTGELMYAVSAEYWLEHAMRAVDFSKGAETLLKEGATTFVEIGPHPMLLTLTKTTHSAFTTDLDRYLYLPSLKRGQNDWEVFLGSLSQLYARGVHIKWPQLLSSASALMVDLPDYPFEANRYWATDDAPIGGQNQSEYVHPLLGSAVHIADSASRYYHRYFAPNDRWLVERKIRSEFMLEMALASVIRNRPPTENDTGCFVKNFRVHNIPAATTGGFSLQTRHTACDQNSALVEIFFAAQETSALWQLVASADVDFNVRPDFAASYAKVACSAHQVAVESLLNDTCAMVSGIWKAGGDVVVRLADIEEADDTLLGKPTLLILSELLLTQYDCHTCISSGDFAALNLRNLRPAVVMISFDDNTATISLFSSDDSEIAHFEVTLGELDCAFTSVEPLAAAAPRLSYFIQWESAPLTVGHNCPSRIVLICDSEFLRAVLISNLKSANINVIAITHGELFSPQVDGSYSMNLVDESHYLQLAKILLNGESASLVFAQSASDSEAGSFAMQALLCLTKSLAAVKSISRLFIVTPCFTQALDLSPLSGFALTIGMEYSGLAVKSIQLTKGVSVRALLEEIMSEDTSPQVMLTPDKRLTCAIVEQKSSDTLTIPSSPFVYNHGRLEELSMLTIGPTQVKVRVAFVGVDRASGSVRGFCGAITAKGSALSSSLVGKMVFGSCCCEVASEIAVDIGSCIEKPQHLQDCHAAFLPLLTDVSDSEQLLRTLLLYCEGLLPPFDYKIWEVQHLAESMKSEYSQYVVKIGSLDSTLSSDKLSVSTTVVTGALGGIGMELLHWLAENCVADLSLLSRNKPTVDQENVLQRISQSCGISIRHWSCDVSSKSALLKTLGSLNLPIQSIFHTAGTIADGLAVNLNWDKFERVFRAKIMASWHLHQVSIKHHVQQFVAFSSVVSVTGNPGQANYSAANAYMDCLMHYRRSVGLAGQSINWGLWPVGMGDRLTENKRSFISAFSRMNMSSLFNTFSVALRENTAQVIIAQVDWTRAVQLQPHLHSMLCSLARAPHRAAEPHSKAASANTTARSIDVQMEIKTVLSELLHIPLAKIDESAGFMTLGMDSITAVEFRDKLQRIFHGTLLLSSTIAFDYPSVNALSEFLSAAIVKEHSQLLESTTVSLPPLLVETCAAESDAVIAIVGLDCRMPSHATDDRNFWNLMVSGRDGVVPMSESRKDLIIQSFGLEYDNLGHSPLAKGGFLNLDIDQFDADYFSIGAKEATNLDPQQRLLLECANNVVEKSGLSMNGTNTGVYVGVSSNDYLALLNKNLTKEELNAYLWSGNSKSMIAGRLSYFLNLRGSAISVDTACSSTIVALHYCCEELLRGENEFGLVAGVQVLLSPITSWAVAKAQMLSDDHTCRSFGADGKGFVRSEGAGAILLQKFPNRESLSRKALAIVRATCLNQDGTSSSLTAPNGSAQQRVISQAVRSARLAPSDIGYLEAHGTGTAVGDSIELNAAIAVYGHHSLIVGTGKPSIGHSEAASGVAALARLCKILGTKYIPSHLHVDVANQRIEFGRSDAQLAIVGQQCHTQYAGLTSFGFSGTNAHIICESVSHDAIEKHESTTNNSFSSVCLLPLAAKSESALQEKILLLADLLLETNAIANNIYFRFSLSINCSSASVDFKFTISDRLARTADL